MQSTEQKLREACNYIDALGGDSRSYRQALALPTADHAQSKPSVEFDLGETSSHTVKCVWSEWDAKANKLVMCLSVRDIETAEVMINGLTQSETDASASVSGLTAAPVGEREAFVIAYRLDYPASEGVGLPRFFGADDGERAHTFAFNHKATITELCDRAALSAGDAADARRWRYAMDWGTKDFAVCMRVGATGVCWEPIKTDGPIDAAMRKGQL